MSDCSVGSALEAFKAMHNYSNDTVTLPGIEGPTVIQNKAQYSYHVHIAKLAGVNLPLDAKQYKSEWLNLGRSIDMATTPICIVTNINKTPTVAPQTHTMTKRLNVNPSIYTCHTDTFKPE